MKYGFEVPPNQYPWMAFIQTETKDGRRYEFGGFIISENFILTAAHGLRSANKVWVCVGETRTSKMVQWLEVKGWKLHEEYYNTNNDIGIIKLQKPLFFSETVFPISLPNFNDSTKDMLNVAGSGRMESVPAYRLREAAPFRRCQYPENIYINSIAADTCAYTTAHVGYGSTGGPMWYNPFEEKTPVLPGLPVIAAYRRRESKKTDVENGIYTISGWGITEFGPSLTLNDACVEEVRCNKRMWSNYNKMMHIYTMARAGPGDSGVPVMSFVDHSKPVAVGIISCHCAAFDYHTRIQPYLDWIRERMQFFQRNYSRN